jgi:hypothetical protein
MITGDVMADRRIFDEMLEESTSIFILTSSRLSAEARIFEQPILYVGKILQFHVFMTKKFQA